MLEDSKHEQIVLKKNARFFTCGCRQRCHLETTGKIISISIQFYQFYLFKEILKIIQQVLSNFRLIKIILWILKARRGSNAVVAVC
jgi:hypothetical protein